MRTKAIIGLILIAIGLMITVVGYEKQKIVVCRDIPSEGYHMPIKDCTISEDPNFQIMFYIGIIVTLSGIGLFVYSIRKSGTFNLRSRQ